VKICKEAFLKGYRTTRKGEVIGLKKAKLSPVVGTGGYLFVTIYINKIIGQKRRHLEVHRLVAYHKYGDKLFSPGMEVRHIDGNKTNNSWDNIVLGTHFNNAMDVPLELRIKYATHAGRSNSKLTKEDVKEIRRLRREEQLTYREILEIYPTSKAALSGIINKKTWKNV